jgi:DNA-binding phage protein
MIKTEPFDAARYLKTPEAQAELLNDAFLSGDAGYISQALVSRFRSSQVLLRWQEAKGHS